MRIEITIEGKRFEATLDDSAAATCSRNFPSP